MAWKAQRKVNILKASQLVFPKVFTGIIPFENDGLFDLYSESIFFKQPYL